MKSPTFSTRAAVPACSLDDAHDGGAHGDAVGEPADDGHLLGRGNAEANAQGLGRHQPQRAQLGVEVGRQLAAGARHAGQRDHVDETPAQPRDGLHPGRRGGRRHHVHHVEAGRLRLGPQRLGLLVGQVGHDHAVGARLDGRPGEALEAEGQDRVVVGHQHQWYPHLARAARRPSPARGAGGAGRQRALRPRAGSPGRRRADRRTARPARSRRRRGARPRPPAARSRPARDRRP